MDLDVRTFAVLLVFLVALVPAYNAAFTGAATPGEATENHTIRTDQWTHVDVDAQSYADNETVTYNGSTLQQGTDYRWSTSNGSIRRASNSSVPNGSKVTIDYHYRAASKSTKSVNTTLSAVFIPMPYLELFLGAMVVVGLITMLSKFGGGSGGR